MAARLFMWGDDLGRGSYNRGETVGQGSSGRSHELAISSSKQYALMATCWPLLVVPAHLPLPRPSLARILAFQPFPAIKLHLQTWMSRTKSYLYAYEMDAKRCYVSARVATENDFEWP